MILIAILGWSIVVGSMVLYTVSGRLGLPHKPKEALNPRTYEARWQDLNYVNMIHKTMRTEVEALGETKTVCSCSNCIAKPHALAERVSRSGSACRFNGCKNTCSGNNKFCYKHRDKERFRDAVIKIENLKTRDQAHSQHYVMFDGGGESRLVDGPEMRRRMDLARDRARADRELRNSVENAVDNEWYKPW